MSTKQDSFGPRRTVKSGKYMAALVTISTVASSAVMAQGEPLDTQTGELQEVVVTGTNVRGAAPVGQQVINLTRETIEATAPSSVAQLLTTAVPQMSGFGGSSQSAGAFEPRMRSLGGAGSAATLVLVDGHRITPASVQVSDPNLVPVGGVDRVDVLSGGASAVYGADAVAGVINIVTRKTYNGAEAGAQIGFADRYRTHDANAVFGRSWDVGEAGGNVLVSYQYSHQSALSNDARDYFRGDQTSSGGSNFNTFACAPATVIPAAGRPGAGLVFAYPYSGAGLANNPIANGMCSTARVGDFLPDNVAHRVFISLNQAFGERIDTSAKLFYSNLRSWQGVSRGTISGVTVFGPGSSPPGGTSQINPFFVGPAGVNQESVSYDFNSLFGAGAYTRSTTETILGNLSADIKLSQSWALGLTFSAGLPRLTTTRVGTVNTANARLALNGTEQANGSPTSNLLGNTLATVTTGTRALTASNSFNPFAPGAAGTSQAVLDSLLANNSFTSTERPTYDVVAKMDGSLFHMPGGDAKLAVGVEDFQTGFVQNNTQTSPIGGTLQSVTLFTSNTFKPRRVRSGFVELNLPLVSKEMSIPLVHSLILDMAGRYDKYSDLTDAVSSTKNPKIGANWSPTNDVLVRVSYGKSFVAPNPDSVQLVGLNGTAQSYFGGGGATLIIPAGYPNRSAVGCPATGTCTLAAGQGYEGVNLAGIGNPYVAPMTGKELDLGIDWNPRGRLDGLRLGLSYWMTTFDGVITNAANPNVAMTTPGLEAVVVFAPTADQIARSMAGRPATTTLPTNIAFLYNSVPGNFYNFDAAGVDFDIGYRFDTSAGKFSVGAAGEWKTKFRRQISRNDLLVTQTQSKGPWVDVLGVNNSTNTFNPVQLTGRLSLGWNRGPARVDLFGNYVSSYYNTDSNAQYVNSPCPTNITANGLGCQKVASIMTLDLHTSYDFKGGLLNQLQVFADIKNLLNTDPPFVNSIDSLTANGAPGAARWANPVGRYMSVGVQKRW